ncbi:MAG: hypothetical protein PVI86_07035, partial [Phycisphaerae bacterium]
MKRVRGSALGRAFAAGLVVMGLASATVMADGTEELGPPSIAIASGSGIVAAGVGLDVQPGMLSIDV